MKPVLPAVVLFWRILPQPFIFLQMRSQKKAFESENPAELGSRCTVFMTSNIVTEQRNGKSPEDIMAGLCRSIIENVFTKVIRVSNLDSLGEKIVVQGGTFEMTRCFVL